MAASHQLLFMNVTPFKLCHISSKLSQNQRKTAKANRKHTCWCGDFWPDSLLETDEKLPYNCLPVLCNTWYFYALVICWPSSCLMHWHTLLVVSTSQHGVNRQCISVATARQARSSMVWIDTAQPRLICVMSAKASTPLSFRKQCCNHFPAR